MTKPEREGERLMLQRNDIVVQIIAVNTYRLKIENKINGLDIERRALEQEVLASPDSSEQVQSNLKQIEAQVRDLLEEIRSLEAQCEWLDRALANFDEDQAFAEGILN